MRSSRLIFLAIFTILAPTCGYLASRAFSPASQIPTLHTYSISNGKADEIASTLNHVFANQKNEASAQTVGAHLLVVRAPETFQQGVTVLIDRISDEATHQTKSAEHSIRLDYWFIESEANNGKPFDLGPFGALGNVLKSIQKRVGLERFAILEHLSVVANNGREVRIKGPVVELKSFIQQVDGKLNLKLDIGTNGLGELKSDMSVLPGEYVVLGENLLLSNEAGRVQKLLATDPGAHPKEVFHVIHTEILP